LLELLNALSMPEFGDLSPKPPLAVAFSGGADSTALLLACVAKWGSEPVQRLRAGHGKHGSIFAIHIHHGLQAAADGFASHCSKVCSDLGVPLHIEYIHAHHQSGESPEEAARLARYQAIARVLTHHWGGEVRQVLLGQHADDQVETLLLALSRGAGIAGISCMAPRFKRQEVTYYRPFLGLSSALIRESLTALGQTWVEDPTNADTHFTRNKIRAQIVPSIAQAFPAFRETFARTAQHAAQAQSLLEELAAQDLKEIGEPPLIANLQLLSTQRQANLLRYWFKSLGVTASSNQMRELLIQIKSCTTRAHKIHIKLGRGYVRRDGVALAWSESVQ